MKSTSQRLDDAIPLLTDGAAAMAVIATLSAVTFALYTDQRWEDAFITLRHSRNAALGHGLTYEPGERIQGFTSPIIAVLAAIGFKVFGADSLDAVMWLLRACNIAGYATAIVLIQQAIVRTTTSTLAMVAACGLCIAETKALAFTINGMETGILLGLLAVAWSLISQEKEINPRRLGVCWAALLWTRPDASVYVAFMIAAQLAWRAPYERRRFLVRMAHATAWAAPGYVPWLLFAYINYGQIVPQSIVAKSTRVGGFAPGALAAKLVSVPATWTLAFLPPYADRDGWRWLAPVAFLAGGIGVLLWPWSRVPLQVRRASLVSCSVVLYLALLQGDAPWYFPPVVLFSAPPIAWAIGAPSPRRAIAVCAATAMCVFAAGSLRYARLARAAELDERQNRYAIGKWLNRNAAPSERIFTEGPGIIGFFAERKMLDYPGLTAPEVVATFRDAPQVMATPVAALRPEWLVLRPRELHEALPTADARARYREVKIFDTSSELAAHIGDQPSLLWNASFAVLKRTP